jgi:hypothetical protein
MGHMQHDPIGQVGQSEYAKVEIVPFSKLFFIINNQRIWNEKWHKFLSQLLHLWLTLRGNNTITSIIYRAWLQLNTYY